MALAYSGSPLAECPHDLEVVGSNPAPATKNLQLVGLVGELFSYLPITCLQLGKKRWGVDMEIPCPAALCVAYFSRHSNARITVQRGRGGSAARPLETGRLWGNCAKG